jgi:hypothetical protein
MYTTQPKKKDDMTLRIRIDLTKVARGHLVYPKAGRHKDRQKRAKVAARAALRKELATNLVSSDRIA